MIDRLVYRKSRWKAWLSILFGIGLFGGAAIVLRQGDRYPIVGASFLALIGGGFIFVGCRDLTSRAQLIVTPDGVEITDRGRSRKIGWRWIRRVTVAEDSDGPGPLEFWMDSDRHKISTDGWDETPTEMLRQIKSARRKWRDAEADGL